MFCFSFKVSLFILTYTNSFGTSSRVLFTFVQRSSNSFRFSNELKRGSVVALA